MKFEIRHRISGKVLFSKDAKSSKLCVEAAIDQGASLRDANLTDANLTGAYLAGANLEDAYLAGANLAGANLRDANLTDANLRGAYLAYANLRDANLTDANLAYANLRGAYLAGAYLAYANLTDAYLAYANLTGAYLAGANLAGANLTDAKGLSKYLTTNLYMLSDQTGKIRAYKLVNNKNEGPYNGGLIYEIGKTVSVKDADCDENKQCSYGISLADLPWCLKEWRKGYKILVVEFTAKDIAAIPIGSDGKFRVKKCKVIREKNLKKLGLIKENK